MLRATIARRFAVKRTADTYGGSNRPNRRFLGNWFGKYRHIKARLGLIAMVESDRLANAIEALPDSFALWDGQNNLVTCNARFREFFGLLDVDMKPGMSRRSVMRLGTRPVQTTVIENRDNPRPDSTSFEVLMPDGRWLHINESKTDEGGLVSVGTDITVLKQNAQKILENEKNLRMSVRDLRESRRELERQKQILVELSERYATEKNRAEAANHAKSQFLANISHELRTPLNAVIGFSEIMQHGLFGDMTIEKYSEYSRDIHESGRFLLEVINDILDMSRIESGRMDLNLEDGNICEVFSECMRMVSGIAGQKNIELSYNGPRELAYELDRRAFKQIILNLLSNAVKFTPNDGQVTIFAEQGKDYVSITIEDTGIGIPASEIAKLGRPFEQIENQFTKSHGGTGLGLAISRSLVELHGGHLTIKSQLHKGTKVTCRFPVMRKKKSEQNPDERQQNVA